MNKMTAINFYWVKCQKVTKNSTKTGFSYKIYKRNRLYFECIGVGF